MESVIEHMLEHVVRVNGKGSTLYVSRFRFDERFLQRYVKFLMHMSLSIR